MNGVITKRAAGLPPFGPTLRGELADVLKRYLPWMAGGYGLSELENQMVSELGGEDELRVGEVKAAFDDAYRTAVRDRILNEGVRPDGRSL